MVFLRKLFFSLILLLILGQNTHSQQVKIYARSKEIGLNEPLTLVVEVQGPPGRFDPVFPSIEGMVPVGMRSRQSSTDQLYVYERSYMARATGTYRVPAFSYQGQQRSFTSPSFTVVVKEKSAGGKAQPPARGQDPFAQLEEMMRRMQEELDQMTGGSDYYQFFHGREPAPDASMNLTAGTNDCFLLTEFDKKECFVGEQLLCQVHLYIPVERANETGVFLQGIHRFQGRMNQLPFWQEVIDMTRLPEGSAVVKGKRYLRYTIYQTILFPVNEGEMKLDSLYLDVLRFPRPMLHHPLQAMELAAGVQGAQEMKVLSLPVTLTVNPLPKTLMPASGAVGSEFHAAMTLGKGPYKTGEPVQLKVTITGKGNLVNAAPPVVKAPESFLADPPSANFTSQKGENGYFSAKEFTLSFVPLKSGTHELGPVKFYYFKPEKMWYDSLVIDAVNLEVTGPDISAEMLDRKNRDVFYEHALARASTHPHRTFPLGRLAFSGTVGAVLIAGFFGWWRRRRKKD